MIYFSPMSLYYRKSIKPVLTLFFSLSVLFAGIAIRNMEEIPAEGNYYLLAGFVLMFIHLISYSVINYVPAQSFPVLFLIFGAVIILSIIAAGAMVHPDFLRSAFHSAGQLFIISLYRKKDIYREDPSKNVTRSLILISLVMIFASAMWMLLLGYHIIFKKIDSGFNWMLFNLYSVVNILVGIDAVIILQNSLNRHVIAGKNFLKIDGNDYSNLLSPSDLEIISLFAGTPDRKLNCSRIMARLNIIHDETVLSRQCSQCLEQRMKATLCSDYKRIYNQINKLKRFFETMDIGTILPPKNKMEITSEGWSLHMFENTRLHIDK